MEVPGATGEWLMQEEQELLVEQGIGGNTRHSGIGAAVGSDKIGQ